MAEHINEKNWEVPKIKMEMPLDGKEIKPEKIDDWWLYFIFYLFNTFLSFLIIKVVFPIGWNREELFWQGWHGNFVDGWPEIDEGRGIKKLYKADIFQ